MGANAQTSVPAFTAGQVLTAAQMTQVNTGIPVFASSTERDAAFGGTGEKTLAEGQMAYLEDTNATQYYDGSSWAAVAGGKILQVVQTVAATQFSTTSTSFVDITGLSVTITPTSATSKVLVHASVMGEKSDTNLLWFNMYRGGASSGTSLGDATQGFGFLRINDPPIRAFLTAQYLDSPATTSATTYTAAGKVNAGTGVYMKDSSTATITVMEVSA